MAVHKKYPALGRGLDALISTKEVHTDGSSTINEIELDKISPNPNQPRRDFDPESLRELADSIAEIGIVREGGSVRVESEKYHPCRVFPQLKGYWYVVVPTNVTIVNSIIPQLKAAEERITAIVNPEGR